VIRLDLPGLHAVFVREDLGGNAGARDGGGVFGGGGGLELDDFLGLLRGGTSQGAAGRGATSDGAR
jgi:hypothetical protein